MVSGYTFNCDSLGACVIFKRMELVGRFAAEFGGDVDLSLIRSC